MSAHTESTRAEMPKINFSWKPNGGKFMCSYYCPARRAHHIHHEWILYTRFGLDQVPVGETKAAELIYRFKYLRKKKLLHLMFA